MMQRMIAMGSGGEMSETVIWENASPSASAGFNYGTYNLITGKKISDYRYIKIEYAYAYNQCSQDSDKFSVIYDVETFTSKGNGSSSGFSGCLSVTHRSNGLYYDRVVQYKNDTQIEFGSAISYKISTAGTASNIFVIPLQIIGLK